MFNQLFTVIRDLFGFFTIGISACTDLAEAGKYQTTIIKDSSEFDARKKRIRLEAEMADFQRQLAES